MSGIRKEDIVDAEIIDAVELLSDGTSLFIDDATVVSTTSSTKAVVVSGVDLVYDKEERLEVDDIVTLSGTSGGSGNGTFTVASITDSTTFVVNEAIGDSTGGTADFKHPPGASKVGCDPTNISDVTATNVQEALEELSQATGGEVSISWRRYFLTMGG